MKTTNDILTDIYHTIKSSDIDLLNGGIYKHKRPTDSILNDCVFRIVAGNVGKFVQNAALYVKIFYKDINSNNTYSEDFIKASELQSLLFDLSQLLIKNQQGYSYEIDSREIYSESVEENNEHYAILKINLKNIQR